MFGLFRRNSNNVKVCDMGYMGGCFRMVVNDVFSIVGRGTIVTGIIELGSITEGESIMLCRMNGSNCSVQVTGIEISREEVEHATQGDSVGLLLRGVSRSDISRGDILVK